MTPTPYQQLRATMALHIFCSGTNEFDYDGAVRYADGLLSALGIHPPAEEAPDPDLAATCAELTLRAEEAEAHVRSLTEEIGECTDGPSDCGSRWAVINHWKDCATKFREDRDGLQAELDEADGWSRRSSSLLANLDAANEARDKAIKERDEARAHIQDAIDHASKGWNLLDESKMETTALIGSLATAIGLDIWDKENAGNLILDAVQSIREDAKAADVARVEMAKHLDQLRYTMLRMCPDDKLAQAREEGREVGRLEWNHETNEWADLAISAFQWLRNIEDGVSTAEEAIQNVESGIDHCRKVGEERRAALKGGTDA